jgi:hypothetical protein
VWRLVIRKIATLQEIETHYSLIDLMDANEVLDLQDRAESQAVDEAKRAQTR